MLDMASRTHSAKGGVSASHARGDEVLDESPCFFIIASITDRNENKGDKTSMPIDALILSARDSRTPDSDLP